MKRGTLVLVRVVLLVGLGVVATTIAIMWGSLSARHNAEQLLREVRALEVSNTTFADVKRLTDKYTPHVSYSSPCTREKCYISVRISNSWLHRLRLAPQTTFEAHFSVRGNRLHYSQVGFDKFQDRFHYRAFAWDIAPLGGDTLEESFFSSCTGDPDSKTLHRAIAYLGPSATPEERDQAFTFTFDCLTKIGGCERVEDFMPKVCNSWSEPN